jgi:hypothetical protein
MLAGMAALFGGLAMAYAAVAFLWPNSLPAPAIGRLVHIDEKLRYLRENPDLDPRVLAVGSSITWRQLDGAAFEKLAGGPRRFLNGGTAALNIHQTRDLLDFYLEHYPNVQTVLVLTNQIDFSDCTEEPERMVDHEAAADYAFRHWPTAYFYVRFFSPQRYVSTAWTIAARRQPFLGDLFMDAYASGPLMVPESMKRGLRYRPVETDPACYDALVDLSRALAARDVRLVVVFPPAHPEFRRSYPAVAEWLGRTVQRLKGATKAEHTRIISLYDDPRFPGHAFYDAYHLEWPAVQRLSALLAAAMERPDAAVPAPDNNRLDRSEHMQTSQEPGRLGQ